jgi:ubiquinone/menaquinone biosynthesis C-methylase UbiE
MIHVGMNVSDKTAAYREVRRVLKNGGLFVVFDILSVADGPLRYPVPWAATHDTSFVEDSNCYRTAPANRRFPRHPRTQSQDFRH